MRVEPQSLTGDSLRLDLRSGDVVTSACDPIAERRVFAFDVLGTPAPKGSTHATLINGRPVNLPAGSSVNRRNLRHWDTAIREAAIALMGDVTAPPFVRIPLVFEVRFRLARPAGHWGKRGLKPSAPKYPIGKPDGDKLARQAADSLATILFDDDARIVSWRVDKVYAAPGQEGARFSIYEAT